MVKTISKESILKEDTRPTFYRTFKYWGKKPHNIWGHLIKKYSTPNSYVGDPFAGSGLTFFESIKNNRKSIICDINPLTKFIVDFYSREYDKNNILDCFNTIKKEISSYDIYKRNYRTRCMKCNKYVSIGNYRWENNKLTGKAYRCNCSKNTIIDKRKKAPYSKELNLWKPIYSLRKLNSISDSTIEDFGGSNITNIYTNRNIQILSLIFNKIIHIGDTHTKIALFCGFLKTIHLTTKMNALRSVKTKRPLSTSWGRPAYMFLSNRLEQNPLLQFERAIMGANGVLKSIFSREKYMRKYSFSDSINDANNIFDGIILTEDSKNIKINKQLDLIITDPPYGGIINYGELSMVWNLWLNKFDNKYPINIKDEIIINKNKSHQKYEDDLYCVLNNWCKMLNKGGNFVITFNSDNIVEWDCIKSVLKRIGLKQTDSYLQKNKRCGETNVVSTEGKTISDYYFVMKK